VNAVALEEDPDYELERLAKGLEGPAWSMRALPLRFAAQMTDHERPWGLMRAKSLAVSAWQDRQNPLQAAKVLRPCLSPLVGAFPLLRRALWAEGQGLWPNCPDCRAQR